MHVCCFKANKFLIIRCLRDARREHLGNEGGSHEEHYDVV